MSSYAGYNFDTAFTSSYEAAAAAAAEQAAANHHGYRQQLEQQQQQLEQQSQSPHHHTSLLFDAGGGGNNASSANSTTSRRNSPFGALNELVHVATAAPAHAAAVPVAAPTNSDLNSSLQLWSSLDQVVAQHQQQQQEQATAAAIASITQNSYSNNASSSATATAAAASTAHGVGNNNNNSDGTNSAAAAAAAMGLTRTASPSSGGGGACNSFDLAAAMGGTSAIAPAPTLAQHLQQQQQQPVARSSSFEQLLLMSPTLLGEPDTTAPTGAPQHLHLQQSHHHHHHQPQHHHHQQRQQQHHQHDQYHHHHHHHHSRAPSNPWSLDSFMLPLSVPSSSCMPDNRLPEPAPPPPPPRSDPREDFLDDISLKVEGLSLEPMSGREILKRLRECFHSVTTRFIPCVDFLVQCQQDLRKGLAVANKPPSSSSHRRAAGRSGMTSAQFYNAYVEHLPSKFFIKNQYTMEAQALQEALDGLDTLKTNAKAVERQGCEAMKNNFLGGMKEGESWGLRKWLSKHGNALRMCTDLECILRTIKSSSTSCNSSNTDDSKQAQETTTIHQLCELLRPMAQAALTRLQSDIPPSYQERSAAHPYLPFFHRLEAALRGMATYDPSDDDVICLDDSSSDDEDIEVLKPPATTTKRRNHQVQQQQPTAQRKRHRRTASCDDDDTAAAAAATIPRLKLNMPKYSQQQQTATAAATATAYNNNNNDNASDDDDDDGSSSGESDNESIVEVVGVLPVQPLDCVDEVDLLLNNHGAGSATNNNNEDWTCSGCSTTNLGNYRKCVTCGEENFLLDLFREIVVGGEASTGLTDAAGEANNNSNDLSSLFGQNHQQKEFLPIPAKLWPILPEEQVQEAANFAYAMADALDELAVTFEERRMASVRPDHVNPGNFWEAEHYASALRLFGKILRMAEAAFFIEPIDDEQLVTSGLPKFSKLVKNPLCFREVVASLIQDLDNEQDEYVYSDGQLRVPGLRNWNMWKGYDLLQAVDLVFLNCLGYGKLVGEGRSKQRSNTNKLRKTLWSGISEIVVDYVNGDAERKKECTPTRRSETSGFVVFKSNKR